MRSHDVALPAIAHIPSLPLPAAGIEWDDALRGKSDGAVTTAAGEEVRYFRCVWLLRWVGCMGMGHACTHECSSPCVVARGTCDEKCQPRLSTTCMLFAVLLQVPSWLRLLPQAGPPQRRCRAH